MADIRDALRQLAIQIRDEHRLGANTAKRVGSLLLALVDSGVEMDVLEKIFLRKDQEDTAQELIRFLKGLVSEGLIKALGGIEVGENGSGITVDLNGETTAIFDKLKNIFNITSADFSSGNLGAGFVLKTDPETGRSYLEVDELLVRKVAYFVELIIKQLKHVGGEIVLTPASMKCVKVEELTDAYRCYFEQNDGRKSLVQEFAVGDQARRQTFNIKEDTSHGVRNNYYWRLVTAIGDDYIDLSKTDGDAGSGMPEAGDEIIQLGNRNDATRQSAIILSTVGDDAPSIKQYNGINSYSLKGRDVTVLSPLLNKFVGRFVSVVSGKDYDDMFADMQGDIDIVKSQTDKEYTLWFFDYKPTLNNLPASDWTADVDKAMHEHDMFYNRLTGYGYRFEKMGSVWAWSSITDHQTIKALENASKAQDTADSKRRVFVSQPTADKMYDVGDLWTNATFGTLYKNDTLVCKTGKSAGEVFSISHWKPASTATTAYLENLGDRITLAVTDSEKGIEAAKELAMQGIDDASAATQKALNALGIAQSADSKADQNTAALQVTTDSIAALVAGIFFDAAGNITNIATSGLVTTNDFNTLLSKKVSFDADGNVSNINTSGLVTNAAFAQLFSEQVAADGLVKRSEISTFITADDAGNLISNATITADQIRLEGTVTANGYFKILENGMMEAIGCKIVTREGTETIGFNSEKSCIEFIRGEQIVGEIGLVQHNMPSAGEILFSPYLTFKNFYFGGSMLGRFDQTVYIDPMGIVMKDPSLGYEVRLDHSELAFYKNGVKIKSL